MRAASQTSIALILAAFCTTAALAEPLGSGFTYQGQLKKGGVPVNDTCDFKLSLWDAETTPPGTPVGVTQVVPGVQVTNGLYAIMVNEAGQFGADAFNGDRRWLGIQVSCPPGGPFISLGHQELTPAPYAVYAQLSESVPWSGVANVPAGFADGVDDVGAGDGHSLDAADGTPVDAVYVDGAGNVGIGTTDPQDKLDVLGGIRSTRQESSFPNTQYLEFKSIGSPGAAHFITGSSRESNKKPLYIEALHDQSGSPAGYNAIIFRTGGQSTPNEAMRISGNGNIGIGAPNPLAQLDVRSQSNDSSARIMAANMNQDTWVELWSGRSAGANDPAVIWKDGEDLRFGSGDEDGHPFYEMMRISNSGNVGIGTTTPYTDVKVHVSASGGVFDARPDRGGFILLEDPLTGFQLAIDNNEIMARHNGQPATLYLNNDGGNVRISSLGTGRLIVPVIEITGADLAEKFPVSEEVKPGMVVEIDPEKPGQLRLSRSAYNRRVAGVVSGANGLSVGVVLGNLPAHEDAPAIAMSGRVWVLCDASNGSIQPGDMLTTSGTSGHAMKVTDHAKAQGAILGKAMGSLAEGKGLVLVLVTLQ